jgi:hypothetical protein
MKKWNYKIKLRLWFSKSLYVFCIFVGPTVLSLTKFGWKGWSIAFVILCQTFSNKIQNWLSFGDRFQPSYAIIKRMFMEVQSLLGGVLVQPPEDGGKRGETKGRGIAFAWNLAAKEEAAAEVEAVGMVATVQ